MWTGVLCVVCVCEGITGALLPSLAQILASGRTLPCIGKRAGLGLKSRSGLENDAARLQRPDVLLSLALCSPSLEAHDEESPFVLIHTNL